MSSTPQQSIGGGSKPTGPLQQGAAFEELTFETVIPPTRCPKTHREHELSARAELKLCRPENHGL